MIIVGAGLAGLLAGVIFPDASILEASPRSDGQHKALLRFRTPDIGHVCGIEFRPVTVNKGVFMQDSFREPSISLANLYSRKVTGHLRDRSIWNVEPCTRYIAPENIYERLLQKHKGRIQWETYFNPANVDRKNNYVISTMPMSDMLRFIGASSPSSTEPEFKRSPIVVRRWRIPNADVYQTVYFPDLHTALYRASITGDLLIAEFISKELHNDEWRLHLCNAFGLAISELDQELPSTKQSFGKILPIDDAWRRAYIYELTNTYNIFSVGRFATWRNILLDDVLHDLYVVKRMLGGDPYSRALRK